MPKDRYFTANSAFSTLPSSQPSFSFLHTVYHLSSSATNLLPIYHLFQSILLQAVNSQPVAQPIFFPLLYMFQHYSSFSHSFQHMCIIYLFIIIRVTCPRVGPSLQAQEPWLQFCQRQVFHLKLRNQGCSFNRG